MDVVGIETIVALAKQESIFIQKLSYITTNEGINLKSKRIYHLERCDCGENHGSTLRKEYTINQKSTNDW